ncbi:putative prophage CPS-53 integrase [Mariprofundus micogutta]|uniref:Putative prophage CPS-53 integrase n=1 Tax=Mariprofundus micogutta TaxID=1921010 RepID=A0A1L8CLY2_9PROT|nr:integrase arm-type DNA-binding domain-containing protein [Mariprofundus micogutta]GAV19927.1 putative prophage CPS-53 integrase [Mariprofundus micogutta]
MALTDIKAKAATVPDGKKQIRISDAGGLYLQVTPVGKYWRINYRFAGKQKTLALGIYPSISLKQARVARDDAKRQLSQGIDPNQDKQAKKRHAIKNHLSTFKSVATEWMAKQSTIWVKTTTVNKQAMLDKHIFPWIGSLPIADIEASDILSVVQRAESRGTFETAHRLRMLCSQIFRYGVATSRIKSDPTRDLKGALTPVVNTHRATITDPKAIGALLRAIEVFEGTTVVKCALQMTPYVFARPGELRHAEWSEVDFDKAEWRIPAEKMKMRVTHIVPLSKQALAILNEVKRLTGSGKYVFPSIRNPSRPMSENTINASLRRIGYSKEEICAHGFRGMASTILHEQGWESDAIERQLAHKEGNAIKAAYNHARHLPERVKMMQHWADYLDGLRDGTSVIPIGHANATI